MVGLTDDICNEVLEMLKKPEIRDAILALGNIFNPSLAHVF